MIIIAARCGRNSEPATRTPVEGIRTPSLRISMKSLYVDVDRRTRREHMRFFSQSETLGMKTG